jgi:hypothetical protein
MFVAALALWGCGDAIPDTCPRPESAEPREYSQGTTNLEDGWYDSVAAEGELLHYPGGAYYRIYHSLWCVPRHVEVWLSFSRYQADGASQAPAAGNQAEIKARDETSITILNGSCVEYWMRIYVACE